METLLGIVFFSIVFVGIYKGGWALVNFLEARFPERVAKKREIAARTAKAGEPNIFEDNSILGNGYFCPYGGGFGHRVGLTTDDDNDH